MSIFQSSNENTGIDTNLAKELLEAVKPDGKHDFIIDWSSIDGDTAAICGIDMSNPIERHHGKFSESENELVQANKMGANIKVLFNTGPEDSLDNRVIVARTENYTKNRFYNPEVLPNFVYQNSNLCLSAYWITHPAPDAEFREAQRRIQNYYQSDIDDLNPQSAHFLPGFIRHSDNRFQGYISIEKASDSIFAATFSNDKKPINIDALIKSLPATPRESLRERIDEMADAISDTCAPYHLHQKTLYEHLVNICDICVRRRYNNDDITKLCIDIGRRIGSSYYNEEDLYGVSYYREQMLNEEAGHESDSKSSNTLFSARSAQIDFFLDTPPNPKRWLLQDCLPLGKVGLLVARGGSGKSQCALQLAISIATGETFIPIWPVDEQGKVLALFAEDDDHEIHHRIHSAANALAVGSHDPSQFYRRLRDNLYVKSLVAKDNLMTSAAHSKEVTATDYCDRLLATIAGIGHVKLIIIDPVSRFRGGQENSAEDTTRFVEVLERIAKNTGATVIAIHHVNKWSGNTTEQTQDASRGSSALTDGVRWQMNLATMSPTEAKEYGISEDDRRFYVTLMVTKNNYAPPQPKVTLKRCEGGTLVHANLKSSKDQKAVDMLSSVVELVSSEAKRGALYSKTGFEDRFGGIGGQLDIGKITLRKLLDEAINKGKLLLHNRKLAIPGRTIPQAIVHVN